MKTNRDPLERLLNSAARAPVAPIAAASFPLEARVLGAWRAAAQSGSGETFITWLRRAAICAGVLALLSLAWNFGEAAGHRSDGDELTVADAAMRVGVEP